MHLPAAAELPALLLGVGLSGVGFGRAVSRGTGLAVATAVSCAFLATGDTWLPLAVGATGLASWLRRQPSGGAAIEWTSFARDLAIVLGGLGLYMVARWLVTGPESTAQANAGRVIQMEKAVRFWIEPGLQQAWLDQPLVINFLGDVYSYGFLAFVAAMLMWTWANARTVFGLLRTSLCLSAALAIVIIVAFPVAPPRLAADAGVVDTIAESGRHRSYANEFAAVPSLHVGWMALGGYAAWRCWPRWWVACVAPAPALLMAFAVIVTGNHYWIDAVVGVGISLLPAVVVARAQKAQGGSASAPGPRKLS